MMHFGIDKSYLSFSSAADGEPSNACLSKPLQVRGNPCAQDRLCFGNEILRIEHLANLSLAFPSRPVLLVKFHEELRALDRLFFRLQVKLRIPADNLLGLRERPVNDGDLPSLKPDAGALSSGTEPPAADHRTGFDRLFAELANGLHQFLGRKAPFLGGLNNHHESHFYFSLWFRVGSWTVRKVSTRGIQPPFTRRTRVTKIDKPSSFFDLSRIAPA